MRHFPAFLRSTIGQKVIMAVTGVVLFGFVLAHMTGNLKIFLGPESLNGYAEFLREVGHPVFPEGMLLWILRIVLLVSVALHIWSATRLTLAARAARPVRYQRPVHLETTYASRTMRWGGVIITAFVIYHLMHMTWGTVHADFRPGDVYHNMTTAFRAAPVAITYAIAVTILGFHLYHGLWSALQTLGINQDEINPLRRRLAAVFAALIVAGFLLPPFAILFGFIT